MSEPAKVDSRVDTYEHIIKVQVLLLSAAMDLQARIPEHDQSKLVSPEREIFDEFGPKLKQSKYGSDEYKAHMEKMGVALAHHYEHNRHHPEFHENGVDDMTLVDLLEMVCDWIAAASRHGAHSGSFDDSLAVNQLRFRIDDQLAGVLRNTATALDG